MAVFDIRQYPRRLEQLQKAYENGSQSVFIRVVLESLTQIVLRTPVDTGAARANWVVNVGPVGSGQSDPDRKDSSGGATILQGQSIVLGNPNADAYTISNALPYVSQLNQGSSPQAQAGFVENSVRNATRRVLRSIRGF